MYKQEARVCETSTTATAGNMTLAGAVTGFRTFASRYANGDHFEYTIEAVDANGVPTGEWETGLGVFVSATPAIQRVVVHRSSNSDGVVTFSAGTKRIYVIDPADSLGLAWATGAGIYLN